MDLVVDANILFAALIKKNIASELLFNDMLKLYVDEFIFTEFGKYEEYIRKKTERTDKEFDKLLDLFRRRVTMMLSEEVESFVEKAKTISPDIKDIPYIALALKMGCGIWSNDKKLKEKQNVVKVYSTEDILRWVRLEKFRRFSKNSSLTKKDAIKIGRKINKSITEKYRK